MAKRMKPFFMRLCKTEIRMEVESGGPKTKSRPRDRSTLRRIGTRVVVTSHLPLGTGNE